MLDAEGVVEAGSSPLARGLLELSIWCQVGAGDHPRSRGVYGSRGTSPSCATGSSPLARGLPTRGRCPTRRRPDHPRSRGVYYQGDRRRRPDGGSSPLARGLQQTEGRVTRVWGIIPARAGFTAASAARRRPLGDHPRSRGVYAGLSAGDTVSQGSSPLARGLLPAVVTMIVRRRIIPARAGFTLPH